MAGKLIAEAERLAGKLSLIRRRIHMHPELGYEEQRTSALIAETLRGLGLDVRTGVAKTGVVGLLKGGRPGRTVAMRADMDALPITEQNDVPYRSRVEGVMHACGHDGNTTTVLGAAMLLAQRRAEIAGNVKFIFQPSEESPPGGAMPMIKAGVLDNPKVDVALGVHVDPFIDTGKIGVRDGPMMAAADDFKFAVLGEASHGAKPHLGVDAIVIAAQVIQALQTIPSRRINPAHPVVVTVGTIKGGYRRNVIADRVDIEGTARTLDAKDRTEVEKLIERTLANVTKAGGGKYEYSFDRGYPVLVSNPAIVEVMREACCDVLGRKSIVEIDEPSMGGEDFAYFVNAVPGMMMRLGTRNKQMGFTHPWHHPKFDLDERALWMGAAVMARAAMMCLERAR